MVTVIWKELWHLLLQVWKVWILELLNPAPKVPQKLNNKKQVLYKNFSLSTGFKRLYLMALIGVNALSWYVYFDGEIVNLATGTGPGQQRLEP